MPKILIVLAERRLYFYKNGRIMKSYPIAIGKPSTPTPTGIYYVVNKVINPGGILGTRWMGLSIPSTGGPYGIHGTSMPWSIGQAVSNGCIRMYNHDIEEIFPHVPIGTTVEIIAGGPADPSCPTGHKRPYIVQPGDTLWGIARRFDLSLADLIAANDLPNPDLIYPGQLIYLPDCIQYSFSPALV
ncbi:MAG: hypothetical protein PWP65_63 [Clostridia bacterium]|nr:hypothetical protein [Clostridia bacterium]